MDRGREVMTTVEAINACIPLNNPELTGHLGSLSKIVHYKKGDHIYDIKKVIIFTILAIFKRRFMFFLKGCSDVILLMNHRQK